MLCSEELPERDAAKSLADQLCKACIRLLGEQMVLRELERRTKIVRVN